jgi:hypothetical protein
MLALMMAKGSPLEHVVQHPLVQRPADWGFLTPNGKITLLSDQIAMMILAGLLLVLFVPSWVRRRRGTDSVGSLVPAGPTARPARMRERRCGAGVTHLLRYRHEASPRTWL